MAVERPRSNLAQTYRQIGPLLSLGVQFVVSILLCFFAGRWLDGKLGTEPILLLVGVVIGGAAGFYHFFRSVLRLQEREDDSDREPEP